MPEGSEALEVEVEVEGETEAPAGGRVLPSSFEYDELRSSGSRSVLRSLLV